MAKIECSFEMGKQKPSYRSTIYFAIDGTFSLQRLPLIVRRCKEIVP